MGKYLMDAEGVTLNECGMGTIGVREVIGISSLSG